MQRTSQHAAFAVDPATGLIAPARQCRSPNQDARPVGARLELIVVHGISLPPGQFGGEAIVDFFCNELDVTAHPYFATIAELRVSAHVLITRTGHVVQFVSFNRRAWHAGQSVYRGRERCNDFSVGIELEGTDETPYADAQYVALNGVLDSLRFAYPSLLAAPVVGHSDIAPGRKTDPGPSFDWRRLRANDARNA